MLRTSQCLGISLALACAYITFPVNAREVTARLTATDEHGTLFSNSPSEKIRNDLREQLIQRAWTRYQEQNFSAARKRQAIEKEIHLKSRLSSFCEFTFTNERFDSNTKQLSMEIRATCDPQKIDAEFESLFPLVNEQASNTSRPNIALLFLGRRAMEMDQFSPNVSLTNSVREETSESTQANRTSSRTVEDNSYTRSQSQVTKTRDAEFKFQNEEVDNATTAVQNALQSNGFLTENYADVVVDCPGPSLKELKERYVSIDINSAWPPNVISGVINAARQCEVPYFAFGLLEIRKSREITPKVTEVMVSLNVTVRNIPLPNGRARGCASMTKQYAGRGADRLEASFNALKTTAEEGSRELVDLIKRNCLRSPN
jgi:hypothetical protein